MISNTLEDGAHRFGTCRRVYLSYSTAFSASASIAEIFFSNSFGIPCRSLRYSGLLYESQTFPSASSQARAFRGRSIAILGEAIINGVPALGLPKINNCAGRIVSPTFCASPEKSMRANTVSPRDLARVSSRPRVSGTGYRLATWARPRSSRSRRDIRAIDQLPARHVRSWVRDKAVPVRHLHKRQRPRIYHGIFLDNPVLEQQPRDHRVDLVRAERARRVKGHRPVDEIVQRRRIRPVAADGFDRLGGRQRALAAHQPVLRPFGARRPMAHRAFGRKYLGALLHRALSRM